MKKTLLIILAAVALSATDCTPKPVTANLSPTGLTAYQNTQVIKVLDLIRDTAINSNNNNLMSEKTTSQIVNWHKSSLAILDSRPNGWRVTVQTGLLEIIKNLPVNEQNLLTPYVNLVNAVLNSL